MFNLTDDQMIVAGLIEGFDHAIAGFGYMLDEKTHKELIAAMRHRAHATAPEDGQVVYKAVITWLDSYESHLTGDTKS